MTKRADFNDTMDLLFDARNLVDALRLVVLGEDDAPLLRHEPESVREDRHRHIIESIAATAVGKIDAALGGAFLDPPTTRKAKKMIAAAKKKLQKEASQFALGRKPEAATNPD